MLKRYRVEITKTNAYFVDAESDADDIVTGKSMAHSGARPAYSIEPAAVAELVVDTSVAVVASEPVIYIPESTNIRRTEYHPGEQRLIVEFHSGARHQYSPVHEKTAQGLRSAPSAGRYFHDHIRAGVGIDSVRLLDSPEGATRKEPAIQ